MMRIFISQARQAVSLVTVSVLILALTGCGGTKVLKEPQPMELHQALASAADDSLKAELQWVIVRDGPGTWAKNADWDEYHLNVTNKSDADLQILAVVVIDSLDTGVASETRRKSLVKGSKKTVRRYKSNNLRVKAGFGAGTIIATGAAVAVVGAAIGTAAAYEAAIGALAAGASTASGAATAAGGALLLAPVFIVGGIVRGAKNRKVNREIVARHTELPLAIKPGDTRAIKLFFPLAPSPQRVEITYVGPLNEQLLIVNTRDALHGLHMAPNAK